MRATVLPHDSESPAGRQPSHTDRLLQAGLPGSPLSESGFAPVGYFRVLVQKAGN